MKKITVVSIPVSNQETSKQFYLKLGFEVLIEAPMDDQQKWLQMGFAGAEASITLVTWFEKMPPGSCHGLIIKVDDLEHEMQTLAEKGVAVGKPEKTPWGTFLSITDPDGNTLNFHEE